MPENPTPPDFLTKLLNIMRSLRTPGTGCPWDLEQDFASIAPYTLEEAYEVADAIERGHMGDLREELGDLLLQVVFHAQMASEAGLFDFEDVAKGICDKMVRRHPHVFADGEANSPQDVKATWEEIKTQEKAGKKEAATQNTSVLDDVPLPLPALSRAVKLQKKAAKVGFDWPGTAQVLDKINEEMAELSAELVEQKDNKAKILDEFGDLLFAYANLARHLDVDPEAALRGTNAKFIRRFNFIEEELARTDININDASLEVMDALWTKAKSLEG